MRARILQAELMDDPAIDPVEHRRALAGLARINALSNAALPLWRAMCELIPAGGGGPGDRTAPFRVLDLATGSGDVLHGLYRYATRAGVPTALTACDISPLAVDSAVARLRAAGAQVDALVADATRGLPLPDRAVDVACCSLFLHHLTPEDTRLVLAEMARVAALGVVVVDLRRAALGLVAAAVVPRLITRSRVVHVDAVRSVRAAWTPRELLDLADRAGLRGATVQREWPWRMTLCWRRPAAS